VIDFSADQIDALTYGRAMDTSRFVRATGFTPAYTSVAALAEFAAASQPGPVSPERIEEALSALRGAVGKAGAERG
jgi:UDP-glucose 4-epimerase